MNNENQPAYPSFDNENCWQLTGLTKLELVAALLSMGRQANPSLVGCDMVDKPVKDARALLAACAEGECCECGEPKPSQSGMTCLNCGRKIKEVK